MTAFFANAGMSVGAGGSAVDFAQAKESRQTRTIGRDNFMGDSVGPQKLQDAEGFATSSLIMPRVARVA
jgi:hypothetical protein